ncbi:MAG: Ig-like domain-containing protein [Kiloniellaceae bacterium]
MLLQQLALLSQGLAERHAFLNTPPLERLQLGQGDAGLMAWAIMASRHPEPETRLLLAAWLRDGEAGEPKVAGGPDAPSSSVTFDALVEEWTSALAQMARSGSLEQRLTDALAMEGEATPAPLSGGVSDWIELAAVLHPLDASVPVSGVLVPAPGTPHGSDDASAVDFGRPFGVDLARDDIYDRLPASIEAGFDVDEDGFSYADDAFRATAQPGYADGAYIGAGGFSGGGLRVVLGGIDDVDILGMSGGWQYQLDLTEASEVEVTFRYQLTHAGPHENDEYAEVLFSFDGTLYGSGANDYIARITGDGNAGPDLTTGWQSFTVDLGLQTAGTYSVVIGGYSNKKTFNDEWTEVLVDEVDITVGGSLVVAAVEGVLANDVARNGLELSALLDSGPANGSLSLASDGSFSYTPNVGFSGTDSFTYRVTDGLFFDSATVQLEVV